MVATISKVTARAVAKSNILFILILIILNKYIFLFIQVGLLHYLISTQWRKDCFWHIADRSSARTGER